MANNPVSAKLGNDLRNAERNWQHHAQFDGWPGGNPWADLRDAWAAKYTAIKAQIEELAA